MWYNSKTNQLQSIPPWGSSWVHPDVQVETYPDWQQVDDNFVPPAPVPTKEQQLVAINSEYQQKINSILQAIIVAQSLGNSTTAAQTKLTATYVEWKEKLSDVISK